MLARDGGGGASEPPEASGDAPLSDAASSSGYSDTLSEPARVHAVLYGTTQSKTATFELPASWRGPRAGVVRVGLFIPEKQAGFGPGLSAGDNRDFDPRFSAERSRATFRIDFARREVRVQVSPSCNPDHTECHDARDVKQDESPLDRHNQVQVEAEDNGGVKISYELTNSKARGPFDIGGPSIDGDLHLRPAENPRGLEVEETADDFPNREAYYYRGGSFGTLYQKPHSEFWNWAALGPGPVGS